MIKLFNILPIVNKAHKELLLVREDSLTETLRPHIPFLKRSHGEFRDQSALVDDPPTLGDIDIRNRRRFEPRLKVCSRIHTCRSCRGGLSRFASSPKRGLSSSYRCWLGMLVPQGVNENGYEGRRISYAFVAHHDIQGFLHAVDVAETLLEVVRPSSQFFASVF